MFAAKLSGLIHGYTVTTSCFDGTEYKGTVQGEERIVVCTKREEAQGRYPA